MTVAIGTEEIRKLVRSELPADDAESAPTAKARLHHRFSDRNHRPIVEESTLSVIWNGKSVHLGNTLAFRLLERLSRRPNQYVTHLDLLRDVWDDEELLTATATVRSTVRNLRRRLCDGGMARLATAIRGHNGRYILEL
jgi:DNA-binding response OmpR family regulator